MCEKTLMKYSTCKGGWSSQNTPKSGDQRCVKELMIKCQSSKGSIVLHLYVNEQTKY
jgi:hypothetical protein